MYWGPHRLADYDAAGIMVQPELLVAPQAAPRRLPRGHSLSRRWNDTVAGLLALQAEYARWLDALPEATRENATGEALQAMVDLDLEEIVAIQPPRGFGRD